MSRRGPLAAPAALGRGAVVGRSQPAPERLRAAPRVLVDAATLRDPALVVERLHRWWATRSPYVVELDVDVRALKAPEVCEDPVWSLAADHLPPLERLRFLVWANAVDCRCAAPVWWHATKAARSCPGVVVGGPADVVLPDGRPAWIDGGPRQPLDVGARDGDDPACDAVLVHRESTERGRVVPVPAEASPAPECDALAADQRAAVAAPTSMALVSAPAGSGKTRVLVERLRHLLRDRAVERDLVLALAYNADAAALLRRRCAGLGVRASTVHAYGLEVLRRHVGPVQVWDEREVRGLLRRLVPVEPQAGTDPHGPYLEALERVRVALVDPREVEREREDVPGLAELFPRYRAELRRRGVVDFPEMVYGAIELLVRRPDARAAEQARVAHLLLDEVQDLTPAYLLLLRLLAAPQLQVFGVGDEDQVIYGHAGASPEHLLRFDRLVPGASHHLLEVNHRCPPDVVEAAGRLLAHNTRRFPKVIRPAGGRARVDGALRYDEVAPRDVARAAGEAVDAWLTGGRPPEDVAVLARVNVALLPVQVELAVRGIPCRSPIGPELLERTGVRAALTYLAIATAGGPVRPAAREAAWDGERLADVLYRPFRPVPGWLRDRLRGRRWSMAALDELGVEELTGRAASAWSDLVRDLDLLAARARRQPTAELLRFVRDHIGVGQVAESLDESAGRAIGASHVDDLEALLQIADRCPEPRRFPGFLLDVLAHAAPPGAPAVRLTSIHRVKGLEWPCVLVVGAAEGTAPHRRAVGAAALEEERRVWHVAITRAREELRIVVPQRGASRFVDEQRGRSAPPATTSAVGHGDEGPATGSRPRRRSAVAGAATTPADARAASVGGARDRGHGVPGFRATEGLALRGAGGMTGTVVAATEAQVALRTPAGALVWLPFGSAVEVEGERGRLVRP